MEAKELRIGNLVTILGSIEKINSITVGEGNPVVNRKPMDMIHPVPLTEEILLKFGFGKIEYGFGNGYIELAKDENGGFYMYEEVEGMEIRISSTIHSLHRLQNLYFSIYEEELEINL